MYIAKNSNIGVMCKHLRNLQNFSNLLHFRGSLGLHNPFSFLGSGAFDLLASSQLLGSSTFDLLGSSFLYRTLLHLFHSRSGSLLSLDLHSFSEPGLLLRCKLERARSLPASRSPDTMRPSS